jgi:hypothetical protein
MTGIRKPGNDIRQTPAMNHEPLPKRWINLVAGNLKKPDEGFNRGMEIFYKAAKRHAPNNKEIEARKLFITEKVQEIKKELSPEPTARMVTVAAGWFPVQDQAEFALRLLANAVYDECLVVSDGKILGLVLKEFYGDNIISSARFSCRVINSILWGDHTAALRDGVRFAVEVAKELFPGDKISQKNYISALAKEKEFLSPLPMSRELGFAQRLFGNLASEEIDR